MLSSANAIKKCARIHTSKPCRHGQTSVKFHALSIVVDASGGLVLPVGGVVREGFGAHATHLEKIAQFGLINYIFASTFLYLDHHVHHSRVVGFDNRGSLPTGAVGVAAATVAVAFVRDDKGSGNLVALGAVVSA